MIDHISHSQLDLWRHCPKAWEFRYVKNIRTPSSPALIVGSAYHKSVEGFLEFYMQTGNYLTQKDCMDFFSDAWTHSLSTNINWRGENPSFYKDQCAGLVNAFVNQLMKTIDPLRVETRYETFVAGIPFVCIVDLEEKNGGVGDHKTASRPYAPADVENHDIQSIAAAYVLGREITYTNYVVVKSKEPYIQRVTINRSFKDILWWTDFARNITLSMRLGIAPTTGHDWRCSPAYCDYWNLCKRR